MLQIGFGQFDARRYAINDTAQRQPVRLAKGGHAEYLSILFPAITAPMLLFVFERCETDRSPLD